MGRFFYPGWDCAIQAVRVAVRQGRMQYDPDTAFLARQQFEAMRALPYDVPDAQARLGWLQQLEDALRPRADALQAAVDADYGGRCRTELVLGEIAPLLAGLRHARRHLRRWMRPQRRGVALQFQPGRAWVQYQPLGCVGIVSPWNYPVLLSLAPLIDALAAGNHVLLKPSELTPRVSDLLAEMLAVFPPDRVAVVQGGADVAEAFCALPFDHLVFTGSTARGRQAMLAAAANLTPVTLELGGKSPALICPGADLAQAVRRIAVGKFFNAGQTCLAPDYVLAPRNDAGTVAAQLLAQAERFFPAVAGNPDVTAIITPAHRARLESALQQAEAAGATVLRHRGQGDNGRMPPAIVINPPVDSAMMQDEIFGPILPVLGYDDLDSAIAFINARPRPLALYLFTQVRAQAESVMRRTISGGVTWNGTILHGAQADLPFGGVGASGMGAYHGEDGFRRLSHARAVYRAGRFSGFSTLVPPHGRAMGWLLRATLRG